MYVLGWPGEFLEEVEMVVMSRDRPEITMMRLGTGSTQARCMNCGYPTEEQKQAHTDPCDKNLVVYYVQFPKNQLCLCRFCMAALSEIWVFDYDCGNLPMHWKNEVKQR